MQKLHLAIILLFTFSYSIYSQNINLSVKGKTNNETSLIKTVYKPRAFKNLKSLNKELDTIQLKLNKKGFINAHLNQLSKKNDSSFTATFYLNSKIKNITLSYNDSLINNTFIKQLSKKNSSRSFTIPFENIETTLEHINTELSRNGSPFIKLKLKNIQLVSEHKLKGDLIINNNSSKRYLSDIIIKGYTKFPKSFLNHYLRIKKDRVFDIKQIKEQTKALKSLRFANEIKPPEVLFMKDSTIIYIYAEKKLSNAFDGFIGFNTEEKTGNLKLNGFANLELTNNLNYGESLKITYKSDNDNQRSFDAKLNLPYLFNTPFGIELDLNLFRKDSSFTTTQQKANVFYQIAQKHQLAANYKISESNNLLKLNNFNIEDYKSNFYSFTYSFFNTSKINAFNEFNSLFKIEYGIGKRKTNTLNINQHFFNLNTYKILNLNFNNSILLKFDASMLNSENFIENELFRFGGINSIRGFNENSLYANLFSVINTEYRYKLNQNIYAHSIIDIGHLKNDISRQELNLYSFGFGFGMKTKGGILKFNYANGRSSEQSFKFSNSKIHLSFTTVF